MTKKDELGSIMGWIILFVLTLSRWIEVMMLKCTSTCRRRFTPLALALALAVHMIWCCFVSLNEDLALFSSSEISKYAVDAFYYCRLYLRLKDWIWKLWAYGKQKSLDFWKQTKHFREASLHGNRNLTHVDFYNFSLTLDLVIRQDCRPKWMS